MEKITKVYEVYPYKELSDEAKQNAIEKLSDINVDYDWYQFAVDEGKAAEELETAGIDVDSRGVSFELDRGSYLYFSKFTRERDGVKGEHKGIYIADQSKLAAALYKDKVISKKVQKAIDSGDMYFAIDINHYGGGSGRNTLTIYAQTDKGYTINDKIEEAEADNIDGWLTGKLEDMRTELQKEYEYQTSRESIEETIEANEYTFTVDGKLF